MPTTGNEYGRAFRDVELEKQVLEEAYKIGLGAQFGGNIGLHGKMDALIDGFYDAKADVHAGRTLRGVGTVSYTHLIVHLHKKKYNN